jgi:hypothetical protein
MALGDFDKAHQIFRGMLWLNPPDKQGARILIPDVQSRYPWERQRDK